MNDLKIIDINGEIINIDYGISNPEVVAGVVVDDIFMMPTRLIFNTKCYTTIKLYDGKIIPIDKFDAKSLNINYTRYLLDKCTFYISEEILDTVGLNAFKDYEWFIASGSLLMNSLYDVLVLNAPDMFDDRISRTVLVSDSDDPIIQIHNKDGSVKLNYVIPFLKLKY